MWCQCPKKAWYQTVDLRPDQYFKLFQCEKTFKISDLGCILVIKQTNRPARSGKIFHWKKWLSGFWAFYYYYFLLVYLRKYTKLLNINHFFVLKWMLIFCLRLTYSRAINYSTVLEIFHCTQQQKSHCSEGKSVGNQWPEGTFKAAGRALDGPRLVGSVGY